MTRRCGFESHPQIFYKGDRMTGLDATNPPPLPKWYLAAPFFNEPQKKLVEDLELLFCDEHVPLFSPRLCDENKKKTITGDDAKVIFARNVDNILDCGCMLAVLDWKLPPEHEVAVIK